MNIALWIVQGLVSLGLGMAGTIKLTTPHAELAKEMP